ncbi:hypothetical protein PENFLA_c015G04071 [Penicillium flavigenum]|uniref:Carrier domain-containing protein n=1 Tax=Penicillium flavigenum TaxID=254877 RepID=A0A1V6T443_9EURO|nr:hypothetical protein PENFLA_c015G04071 [Penicillium flavigenum]
MHTITIGDSGPNGDNGVFPRELDQRNAHHAEAASGSAEASGIVGEKEGVCNLKASTYISVPKEPLSSRSRDFNDEISSEVAAQCHCSIEELEDVYACTALQEGMMALTFKDSSAYTIEHEYHLPPGMDLNRLYEAWNDTAQANPILRTRIVPTTQRGCTQAVVRGTIPWQVESEDDGMPSTTSKVTWQTGKPLAYFFLNITRYTLTVVIHHSVCDDWSMALLLRQANAAYRGEKLVSRPFRPLVEYVQSTRAQADAFWEAEFRDAHLAPMKAFPPLPTTGYVPRPTSRLERTCDIKSCTNDAFTANTKLRLAWAVLQSLYTGSDDILFGAVNAGRGVPVPGVQELCGPALASIPVRIQLCPQNTIAEALSAVQGRWAATMDFEHVGLQNLLHLGQGPEAACQFQTLLSVEPRDGHKIPSLFSQHRSVQKTYDLYSLILRCRPLTGGMWIEARFDPNVIDGRQIKRILTQFTHIYEQIEKEPHRAISDIDPVSPEDREELTRWNVPPVAPIGPSCVHDLIQQRTLQSPHASAISSWDGDLSYQTLDNLSSALAAHLLQHSVGSGYYVPLCLEKSKWTAVAMLGVMKAGAAFVLLDPAYPVPRLQVMIQAIKATLIVASEQHTQVVSQLGVPTILNVDTLDLEKENDNGFRSPSPVMPTGPVYATFTSGSTGTPKGVIVNHSGYVASALAHGGPYSFTPKSRVLQFASPAFDSCIIEHLTTLMFGGCVCIPSAANCHSNLEKAISDFAVNVACLTPTVTRIVQPDNLPTLEVLVFVGEAVLASDVSRWEPFVQVRNAYGPAECSAVFSVQPRLQHHDPANIGFATGSVGWVVDPQNHERLMPVGCPGELLIEGLTVGNGYLSNPDQTAQVFIEAPSWRSHLGATPTLRVYKTGDLVQCAGDGSFRYLGRKDNQVKLHGQRLELADIEHHLRDAFPQASQTVAEILRLPENDRSDQKDQRPEALVIAFVCLPSTETPREKDMQKGLIFPPNDEFRASCGMAESHLSDALPSFMVPGVFLPLSHMPLTPSGKTDRRNLRKLAEQLSWDEMQAYRVSQVQPQLPSSSCEEKLQQIWAQTLNQPLDKISVNESFFRLGGDSVSAMQMAASCQSAGFNIVVADIFRFPSILKLSQKIQESSSQSSPSPSFDEDLSDTWIELSPIQQLFFEYVPEGHNKFTQEFLLRISRPTSASKIQKAVQTITARHSMLQARFEQQENDEWAQIVDREAKDRLQFRKHWLRSIEDQEGVQKIFSDSQNKLDIKKGTLIIIDFIETESQEQYLGLMAHHLVMDLVSWRVLLQDLEDILTAGHPLQPASISFQQWCRLQKDYVQEFLDPEQALAASIPAPPLTYWGPPASWIGNTWGDTVQRSIVISKDATQAIFGPANDAFHTRPVEIIHTAVLYAFSRIFDNRPTPTVFSEGHGREPWDPRIDVSRTVGWFTTIAPLFVKAKKDQHVTELLKLIKDGRRDIPRNGWAYFASRYLHPEGMNFCQGHSPMEILFNYTGLFQQLERPGALLQLASVPDQGLVPMPPDLPRFALVDITATVMHGRLNLSFVHNKKTKHQDRLQKWIDKSLETLEELPKLLQQDQQLTISNFPLLALTTDDQLRDLLHQISGQLDVSPSMIQDIYPCSPIQLGMWLSQVKNPDMYWSHIRWSVHALLATSASVDVDKVKQAWQQVVDRHPILRTVFTDSTGEHSHPVQVVMKPAPANIQVVSESETIDEFQNLSTPDQPLFTHRHGNKKGQPPHQLNLAVQPGGGVSCELVIHHMLVDGVTGQTLLSDFHRAYHGQLGNAPPGLYRTYLEYLQGHRQSGSEEYWKQYLDGVYPCLFPSLGSKTEGAKPPALKLLPFSFDFGRHLRSFGQYHGITISSLLQVAWGVVLRVYTGSDSVCFGYLNSCRDIPMRDAREICGPMINLLVCRLFLADDISVLSTLMDNQDAYARSIDHQHCSLAEVMHSLNLAGQPLFNTAMSLQKEAADPMPGHPPQITLESGRGIDFTEYALTVNVTTGENNIHGDLTYWSNAVDDSQAELIADTLYHVVLQLMDPANTRLSHLNFFSGKNKSRISELCGDVPNAVESCIHSDIERNSQANPERCAVSACDGSFTYGELNRISSYIALHLSHFDVGPDVFVPICFEKSRWVVVALLAVLKAGGAFILLDPAYPAERLQKMIQDDFQCPVILTSRRFAGLAAGIVPKTIVVQDIEPESFSNHQSATKTSTLVSPRSAAYAMFTSGSTGKPKASIIEHQSFRSAAEAHHQLLRLDEHSRVLQFASYAFDASIVEILTTLLTGGCICIPSESDRHANLAEAIRELNVNWALLTPSVARIIDPKKVATLKSLVLGGEGMSDDDVRRWSPYLFLMNAYGPSECSVIATAQTSAQSLASDTANIGYSAGGVSWVVNSQEPNNLMPVGAVGELVIEGPIVGRGYVNRPDHMAAAFLPYPAWLQEIRGRQNGTLYRTGDLVRLLSDGSIRYIGRKDRQVKLRGQRIELNEIEYHVQQCFSGSTPEVFADIVTLPNSDKSYLVASVVQPPHNGKDHAFEDTVEKTRANLEQQVPSFLIPSAFFSVNEVPRLVNGKVNRRRLQQKALQDMQQQLDQSETSRALKNTKNMTTEEKLLQSLWAQVLERPIETVGQEDNFFRLGGDSIAVMKLASTAASQGLKLAVPDVFLHPKLEDLARLYSLPPKAEPPLPKPESREDDQIAPFSLLPPDELVEVQTKAMAQCGVSMEQIEDIYPCTALQIGLAALTAERPGSYIANHRFHLAQNTDLDRLRWAWEKVSATNAILRTRLIETDLGCLQVVLRDDKLHWITEVTKSDQKLTWELLFGQPLAQFEIISGPSHLPEQFDLMVTLHHAVYDAWSLPLLLQRAQIAYHDSESPALNSIPFQKLIKYSMAQARGAENFWTAEFNDLNAEPFPPLPSSSYRPNASERMQVHIQTGPLVDEWISRSTAIRLAWAIVQSQYQSSDDLVFGVVSPGRSAPVRGIETMAAPTIATIPLRVLLDRDVTVSQALADLQERAMQRIPFEQVGLSHIASLGANAVRACSFQTLLVEGRGGVDNAPTNMDIFKPVDTCYEDGASNTYALQVTIILKQNELTVEAAFDGVVLPKWQMQCMLNQFGHILQQVHRHPQHLVREILTLNSQDVQRLRSWNAEIPPLSKMAVIDAIRQHCISQPLAPAICAWDGNLSYENLNVMSDNLVPSLISHGVGPNTFIPIYLDRSRWTIIAVVAVLKTGAAFVLLDTLHPQGRLRTVCEEIKAPLVVTSKELQDIALSLLPNVVVVDEKINTQPFLEGDLPRHDPHHALYAVFTSGSTGKPKGAVVENGSFATMAVPYAEKVGLHSNSRVLHFASYAFDVSILEILGTLFVGACVCVLSESERRDHLASAVTRLQPSHVIFTPSVLRAVTPDDLSSVSTIMLIGEPVRTSDVQLWAPRVHLLNTYGPAECTVVFTMRPSIQADSQAANIGFSIAGAGWVTDPRDPSRLVPLGAVGELLLQGPLVGRGYLNNEEQTAAAFIPNLPWTQDVGLPTDGRNTRLYRTGDLVRYESDGSLCFVGRGDFQVKLRGQRFELGEVEKQVQEAFDEDLEDVVAQIVTPAAAVQSPCLVVFIVPKDGLTASAPKSSPIPGLDVIAPPKFKEKVANAQHKLGNVLPDYMLPTAFVPLRKMPQTIGGKLNRSHLLLSVAAISREQLVTSFAPKSPGKRATATEAERTLQNIWSRALGIPADQIGVEDSFFRLGGDSISALQATSQARAVGIDHSVGDLFRWRTILQVAKHHAQSPELDRSKNPNVEAVYPCTPAQRGILLNQMRNDTNYVTHFIWEVNDLLPSQQDGPAVDINRLASAWKQVVAWHAALRAAFQPDFTKDSQFEQVIFRNVEPPMVVLHVGVHDDQPGVPPAFNTSCATVTRHDGQAVPHQFTICITPSGRVVCRLDINHVIIDAMSLAILQRDLCRAYSEPTKGGTPNDAYQKYVTFVQEQPREEAVEYWRSYLEDMQPVSLPAPRATTEDVCPESLDLLEITLSHRGADLETFCRSTDWTAPNLLYLAWALTLSAFTGADDVCFGTFTSGRMIPIPHLDEEVGQFSNMSICRIRLASQLTLDQIALSLQQNYSAVLSYQTFPLADIATAAGVTMEDLASTAVNVQYATSTDPSKQDKRPSLNLTPLHGLDPIPQDIMMYAEFQEDGQIQVAMTYRPSRVSPSLASQLAEYFDLAVSTIISHQHNTLQDLCLLSVRDRQRLRQWNPRIPQPTRLCVHEAIQQKAQEHPSHLAVSGSNGNMTYKELDQLSSQLALLLIERGISKAQLIPLCFEKSGWVIVAMLGVMKAGGTIVPLDPTQPITRLQDICRRTKASLIVSSTTQAPLARELADEVMELGEKRMPRGWCTQYGDDRHSHVVPTVNPEQAAYILFTSGTTGSPKGVMVSHLAYTHAAKAQIGAFSLEKSSRVLQVSSLAFDVSLMEILTTLIAGATVCVISEPEQSQMMLEGICPFTVSHAFLTPSLASSLDSSKASSWVQTVGLQGEPMSTTHIAQWGENCHLLNAYGPTECAVINTVSPGLLPGDDARNIGRAIGIHCWVVDQHDHNRLLPLGAIGELLLSGPSVGDGYLNDQARTAQAFILGPKWLQDVNPEQPPHTRLYKTGDLVRFEISDGSLRFEGRKDRQIKIRGQRVELEDIEHHTWRCFPGAREAVAEQVMISEQSDTNDVLPSVVPRLVACIWVRSDDLTATAENPKAQDMSDQDLLRIPDEEFHSNAAATLRDLRNCLPGYMVPDLFIPISQMPRTASGKMDRTKLRQIIRTIPPEEWRLYSTVQGTRRAVESDIASKFHKILTRLLNVPLEAVGTNDSFLHFGGDSILAMKIAATSRAEGLEISSHDILRHPTISEWADIVDSHRGTGSFSRQYSPYSLVTDAERIGILSSFSSEYGSLDPNNVEDILPALDFQKFYITHSSPVYTAHVFPAELDIDRLRSACMRVMSHHSILRTVFASFEERLFQIILREVEPAFEVIVCDDPEPYIIQESQRQRETFTAQGSMPVGFTVVTNDSREKFVFVVSISHAQYDGSSLPFLWDAIATAYQGHVLPKTVQFKDVVYNRLSDDNTEAFSFWSNYLQNTPAPALDPLGITDIPLSTKNDTSARREINHPTLLPDTTVSTLVKAAFSWVLSVHVATSDIVLGQVVHGRGAPLPDVDKALGPCINLLPVRININPEWTVEDLVRYVQNQQLETFPYDYVSFENIVERCTNWPAGSKLGCLVHHQGMETAEPFEMGGLRSSSSSSWASSKLAQGQLGVISMERGPCVDIMIAAAEDTMDHPTADRLAEKLAKTIELFSSCPSSSLAALG